MGAVWWAKRLGLSGSGAVAVSHPFRVFASRIREKGWGNSGFVDAEKLAWQGALYQSSTGFADPRGMKRAFRDSSLFC
jgi:hypothetical protein